MAAPDENTYHPQDAIQEGLKTGLVGAITGFGISAVQNTLAKRNVGALGVFTRTGGTIVTFGIISSQNLRATALNP